MSSLLVWAIVMALAGAQDGVASGVAGGLRQDQARDPRARPQSGTASISGRVTVADTGVPLRRALVRLNGPPPARATHTDHEGRYQFTNLPAGSYGVFVNPGTHRAGYQAMSYGVNAATFGGVLRPRVIELAEGQKLENIDVALPRTGVITGRVTDLDGEPASRVQVGAWMLRPGSDPQQSGSGQTDDLGQFRIFGLFPGEYFVLATPAMGGGGLAETEGDPTGFAPSYAPGTPSRAEAMRVRVTRGGQASADIRLTETRVYTISGTVVNSHGEAIQNPSVMLSRADGIGGGGFGASFSSPGSFSIRNVPPGQYQLIVRHMPARAEGAVTGPPSTAGQEYASMPVEVSTSNIDGIALVTRPGGTVTGEVVFDGAPPENRRVNLFTQPVQRSTFMGSPAIDLKDTAFTIRNVFGPLVIRGSMPAPGWGLKAVLLRGKDITDEPTIFSQNDSGHLQVVFTANASVLEGAVTDDSGKGTDDASIILFGEDPKSWVPSSSYLRMMRLIKGGRFSFAGLREGRYLVVAVPVELLGMNAIRPTAELFEALSKVATAVTLTPGEKRSVELVVVRMQ